MAYTEKYVSVAGGGAHDGTSEANAWTLAEAVAAATAGNRVNVKAGTYTLAANITLPNGATENPLCWRGYNSTIGDLLTVGRDSTTGELTDTNFPLIDGGASYRFISTGTYSQLINLSVVGSTTAGLVNMTTAASAYRCKFAHTNTTTGNARAVAASAFYSSVVDCDCIIASNHASAIAIVADRGSAVGCRVWNSATTNSAQVGISLPNACSCAMRNIIYNFGHAIGLSAFATVAQHNSIYDCVNGFLLDNGGTLVAENVCHDLSGYLYVGATSSGNPLLIRNASTAPTSGRIDTSGAGTVIEEIDGISLSGDPFTNSGAGDFTLNNTSGAGALCRNASEFWGTGGDLGAVQTLISASGGSALHLGGLGQTGIGVF